MFNDLFNSGISIYISSTINPILYNLMSERYRTAFKNTFQMLVHCQMPHTASKQKYHGSYLYYYNKQNLERVKTQKLNNNNNCKNNTAVDIKGQALSNGSKGQNSTKSRSVCIVKADNFTNSIKRVGFEN